MNYIYALIDPITKEPSSQHRKGQMNKQGKLVNGKVINGIEWTKTILPDGTERQGYSWNPIAGCFHGCRWSMPDGKIAKCYAETTAENIAGSFYTKGFEYHYWSPEKLIEPLRVAQPAKIFTVSMGDLFGRWVSEKEINEVLEICRRAHWHTFQFLTKNTPRLLQFEFPKNCWVGFSTPPDFMFGRELTRFQKDKILDKALETMEQVNASVRWVSIEPLSWDCADIFRKHVPLDWAVIGAASDGPTYHQPEPEYLTKLLSYFDQNNVPIFMKGNLKWSDWREQFPQI